MILFLYPKLRLFATGDFRFFQLIPVQLIQNYVEYTKTLKPFKRHGNTLIHKKTRLTPKYFLKPKCQLTPQKNHWIQINASLKLSQQQHRYLIKSSNNDPQVFVLWVKQNFSRFIKLTILTHPWQSRLKKTHVYETNFGSINPICHPWRC